MSLALLNGAQVICKNLFDLGDPDVFLSGVTE